MWHSICSTFRWYIGIIGVYLYRHCSMYLLKKYFSAFKSESRMLLFMVHANLCPLLTQQQKTALMRNNSALQNVTLRTKSENFCDTLIQCMNMFPCVYFLVLLLLVFFVSSSFLSACYSLSKCSSLFYYQTPLLPPTPVCFTFFLHRLHKSLYSSSPSYISFPWSPPYVLTLSATFSSSRNAWASKFSHLPFWQLPTVPARIPSWSVQPIPVQECLHQQHCRVSLISGYVQCKAHLLTITKAHVS